MAGPRDWLRRFLTKSTDEVGFDVVPDSKGLNFQMDEPVFADLQAGKGDDLAQVQMAFLQQLEEQGLAEQIYAGYFVDSASVVQLDRDIADVLRLPSSFQGRFETRISGNTRQAAFGVVATPMLANGSRIEHFDLKGPIMSFSDQDTYLLNPGQYHALTALAQHSSESSDRSIEETNLRLVHNLQSAARSGFDADLSHFDKLKILVPDKIGLTVDTRADGSLQLAPNLNCGLSPDEIARGIGQATAEGDTGSVRVGNSIVLLDERAIDAVRHVLERRHVPANRAAEFLETPGMHLDSAKIDLDDGFSKRVKGAVAYTFCEFGADDKQATGWFGTVRDDQIELAIQELVRTPEDQDRLLNKIERAKEQGASEVVYKGITLPLSDDADLAALVAQQIVDRAPETDPALARVDVLEAKPAAASVLLDEEDDGNVPQIDAAPGWQIDLANLARKPFQHQLEGIQWVLSLRTTEGISGGLLADDMGLGKTYMTLVALQQWMQSQGGLEQSKPSLIVAPLALLENWEEEVGLTFIDSPFRDIVVLQSSRDLSSYRVRGGRKETSQQIEPDAVLGKDEIAYALKVGRGYGAGRLDKPGRLVITTYQALASYQFSMCRIDWDFVVFDEAQNLKNLNTLQTRAAKGLKADLKILATGTPVENSLSDFWCLMDTAQPGLFSNWADFNDQYIRPIALAHQEDLAGVRVQVGKALRDRTGSLMLRRLKEEVLDGLPKKTIYSGRDEQETARVQYDPNLSAYLSGSQLVKYDAAVDEVRSNLTGGPAAILRGLAELRAISIHPEARATQFDDSAQWGDASVKMAVVERIISDIKSRNEKVIVFLINKRVQVQLKLWIEAKFGTRVEIVNGDTKATSKNAKAPTRKRIVDAFQHGDGFGVLVMSPIAAGVGLTITGANNVIHLERHWNPAKEAQATDRVYRIGAKRDVSVYLPIVHHPEFDSFEVSLDRLLNRKIDLKDAVVTVDDVDAGSIVAGLGA